MGRVRQGQARGSVAGLAARAWLHLHHPMHSPSMGSPGDRGSPGDWGPGCWDCPDLAHPAPTAIGILDQIR